MGLDFSIVRGGPLYWLGRRLGVADGTRGLFQLAAILAAVTWLPLLFLNLLRAAGAAADPAVSFTWSLGTHTRLLAAIPLFFAAEATFDTQTRAALAHLLDAQVIIPEERPRFDRILRDTMRLRDSVLVEVALIVVTVGLMLGGVRTDLPVNLSNWRTTDAGGFTPAGWWYATVSLPIFAFLLWRWCWRLLVWGILLWRLARLHLDLVPTHPDLAGGLGGLGVAHADLAPLSFGISAMLMASYAEDLLFGGAKLETLVLQLSAIAVGLTVMMLLPLVLFTPRLVAVSQQGQLDYGVLATNYTRAFGAKWVRGGGSSDEPLLGTADLQSLADLGNSFEIIRNMRPVPFGLYQALVLLAAAVLPMLPLLLTVLPLDELVLRSVKSLVGM
ncbi:MAG TPA: hypothetical protein VID28_01240 [Methylomirabilota bacterium]